MGRELETVELKVEERVAWLTLNRPEALNALTMQAGRELTVAIDEVAANPDVRVAVLTGAGRGFSSGADLKEGLPFADQAINRISADLSKIKWIEGPVPAVRIDQSGQQT